MGRFPLLYDNHTLRQASLSRQALFSLKLSKCLGASPVVVRLERMNVNFAERAHNHNWKLDPIVRSLLDTDFYKLLMLQFIWKNFPAVHVSSEVVNRTARVRLAEEVDASALIAQMEHVRGLRF